MDAVGKAGELATAAQACGCTRMPMAAARAWSLQSGEGVARRLLDWPGVGAAERQIPMAALRTQIEAIGRC
jgi:hypothetical protein